MSVTLQGVGGWFTRAGAFIGEYNRVAAQYGSDLDAGFLSIWQQFVSSDQAAVQDLPGAVAAFRTTQNQYLATLQADGSVAMVLQVNDDTDVMPYTVPRAIAILTAQMRANNQSVNRPTVAATVTPNGSNFGDATLAIGLVNQYGDPLDTVYAETVTVTCTSASTSYSESFTATGEAAVQPSSPLWPAGSGATQTITVTNPGTTGIVTDGLFGTWGGTGNNTPTNWDIVDGDAGVTVFRSTDVVRGDFAAQLTSDGSQPTQLAQDVSLTVNTVYMVTVQAKVDSLDGTGVFVMQLTDGDGNVLADDAGTNLSYTRDLNGQVTTSYQPFTAFFSTPRQLPTNVEVRYGFQTAPANGKSLFLDLAAVITAVQLYAQGPFAAMVAGADPSAINDTYAVAVTNSLGSKSFVRGAQRVYDFSNLGSTTYFPSSTSPSISDNLVTN